MRPSAIAAFVMLGAGPAFPQDIPGREQLVELLVEHRRALGGERALSFHTLRIEGEQEIDGRRSRVVLWVRREPFGFRREATPVEPPGDTMVWISDGRYAWRPPSEPLPAAKARACLELAFRFGFGYLDPARIAATPDTREPWRLRDPPGLPPELEPRPLTHWVGLLSPAGTLLRFLFDVEDGRLHEIASPDLPPGRWTRFGAWRRFGALHLPALAISGRIGGPPERRLRITAVDTDIALPDGLFDGCPVAPAPPWQDGGALQVAPHAIAGWAHLVLPLVVLNGLRPVVGMLDTGAGRTTVTPGLARKMALPRRGPVRIGTFTDSIHGYAAWIEQLVLGDRRALQILAYAVELPQILELPADRQPGLLLGGEELLGDSPVLDLQRGALAFRGAPVQPLPGEHIITLPLHRLGADLLAVDITVNGQRLRAALDTGSPSPLLLSRGALLRAGLPATVEAWRSRGAMPVGQSQAGGVGTTSHVATIESFALGPVVFRQPMIRLMALTGEEPFADAFLGAGALLPFARVGLDLERMRLELEPREDIVPGPDGALEVPSFGMLLGFTLVAPPVAAHHGVLGVPRIVDVGPDTPAGRAGLRAGEWLWAVGGVPCAGRAAGEINRQLWLRDGTIELEVIGQDGRRRSVTLP